MAQNNLGAMYAEDRGVTQDFLRAHMWFDLSAAQVYEGAARNRDHVAKRMTSADVSMAERLAREWLEKHDKY